MPAWSKFFTNASVMDLFPEPNNLLHEKGQIDLREA